MAAAAHARWLVREEAEQARRAAEQAEYDRRMQEEQRAEFEAGPENGCRQCYAWVSSPWDGRYSWSHVWMGGDGHEYTCDHECHETPYHDVAVAIA